MFDPVVPCDEMYLALFVSLDPLNSSLDLSISLNLVISLLACLDIGLAPSRVLKAHHHM